MKTIVITGGSDGLGKTLATDLTKDNKVVIVATTEEKLKAVAEANGCAYKVCNVGDYAAVEKVMAEIAEECGSIDVLINNAGLLARRPALTTRPSAPFITRQSGRWLALRSRSRTSLRSMAFASRT